MPPRRVARRRYERDRRSGRGLRLCARVDLTGLVASVIEEMQKKPVHSLTRPDAYGTVISAVNPVHRPSTSSSAAKLPDAGQLARYVWTDSPSFNASSLNPSDIVSTTCSRTPAIYGAAVRTAIMITTRSGQWDVPGELRRFLLVCRTPPTAWT